MLAAGMTISSSSLDVGGSPLVRVGEGLEVQVVDEGAGLDAAHISQAEGVRVGLLSDRVPHDLVRLGGECHDGGRGLEIFGRRCHGLQSTGSGSRRGHRSTAPRHPSAVGRPAPIRRGGVTHAGSPLMEGKPLWKENRYVRETANEGPLCEGPLMSGNQPSGARSAEPASSRLARGDCPFSRSRRRRRMERRPALSRGRRRVRDMLARVMTRRAALHAL